MTARTALVAITAALLVAPAPASRGAAPDCEEWVPAAYTVPPDTGAKVTLSVLVLLDGITLAQARSTTAVAARAYAPLDVTVRATYRTVRIKGDQPMPDGTPAGRPEALFPQVEKAVGGRRPAGTDVVFLLTNKRLFVWADADGDGAADESERTYGIAGVAKCIGGVRWADQSFGLSVGPRPKDAWTATDAGLTMAHEIGHLLGAHHHYAECASGTAAGPRDGVVRTCTIMFNATYGLGPVHTLSDRWSALEAAVIRGHATEYAAP